MAKNLILVRHRETNELTYTFNKTDLARILGVSSRTISRRYNDVGIYQSVDYTIYICDKRYSDGEEKNYNKNVIVPKRREIKTNSPVITDKIENKSNNATKVRQSTVDSEFIEEASLITDANQDNISSIDRVVGHRNNIHISIPVNSSPVLSELEDKLSYNDEEDEQEEKDWRKVEDNLSIEEYDDYYSKRTYEQISQSKLRYDNVRGQSTRLKHINKYGELKMND